MIDLVTASPDAAGTDRWTIIIGLFGFTVVASLLVGVLIVSAHEALKERRVTVRRVDDVRSQVSTIMARRGSFSSLPEVTDSAPRQRVRVSGRANATMPGRRQDVPDAMASRDRSTVT